MRRLGILFWLALVVGSGLVTFRVKYAVQDVEDELIRVRKQTVAEQQEIHVLNAEWTYLNQPERLADLNRRFLALAPVIPKQLQASISDIPLRTAPAQDTLVAAAPERAAVPASPAAAAPAAAVVPATLTAAAKPAAAVLRVAKNAVPTRARSLDALVAQIAETR